MLEELKEKTEHENSKLQELGKQCALLAQERDQVQETLECVQAEKKKLEVNLQESINKVLCLWLKYNNYKCWRADRLFLETVSEKFLMGIIYPNWKILVNFNFCLGELYFRIHTSSFKNLIWGYLVKRIAQNMPSNMLGLTFYNSWFREEKHKAEMWTSFILL